MDLKLGFYFIKIIIDKNDVIGNNWNHTVREQALTLAAYDTHRRF